MSSPKTDRLQARQIVWKGALERRFVELVKEGKSVSELMPHFPDATRRQIEYHLDYVVKKYNLKRPTPIRRRGLGKSKPKRQSAPVPQECQMNFAPQNMTLPRHV